MEFLDYENKSVWMGSNGLQSMRAFDKVESINDKPPVDAEGLLEQKPDLTKSVTEHNDKFSIAETPNLYKHNGVSMSNSSGYFIIPRSLISDPRYQGARTKYQKVLFILMANAAFAQTTHAIGMHLIKIERGQFCVSERRLVELCNEGVKFEEDKVDKNTVRRAIVFFEKCDFVNHKVNHGKSVITITVPGFYENKKLISEPPSEPKVNQKRTTKQEHKENKEDYKQESVCVFSKKIYECVKDESRLTNEQKIELSEKFEEDVVVDAYSSALSYKEPINNFFYFLRSACQKGYKPPPVNEKVQRDLENEIIDIFAFWSPVKQGNFLIIQGEEPIDLRQNTKILRQKKAELWRKYSNSP